MATIDATELSVQMMNAVRKVLEDNRIYIHKGGDPLAIAVSAVARCAYAMGRAGDPDLQGIAIHADEDQFYVDILSKDRVFTAPQTVEV